MDRLARAALREEEARGIKQWDLFMTLRADPVLGAELSAQCALLDYLLTGDVLPTETDDEEEDEDENEGAGEAEEHLGETDEDESESDAEGEGVQMLDLSEVDEWADAPILGPSNLQKRRARAARKLARKAAAKKAKAKANAVGAAAVAGHVVGRHTKAARETVFGGGARGEAGVPDDVAVSAFVCVAKLKLCRLAVAQHEVATREDSVAGEVFAALDPHRTDFVTCDDVQRYLQRKVGIANVTSDDLALVLGASVEEETEDEQRLPLDFPRSPSFRRGNSFGALPHSPSFRGGGGPVPVRSMAVRLLDRLALREVFSNPAHHGVASLLHRFTCAQAKLATNALAAEYAALSKKASPTPHERQRLAVLTRPPGSSSGSHLQRAGYGGLTLRGPAAVVPKAVMVFQDDTRPPLVFDQASPVVPTRSYGGICDFEPYPIAILALFLCLRSHRALTGNLFCCLSVLPLCLLLVLYVPRPNVRWH